MVMPPAKADELRLDVPAGTVTLRIQGQPVRTIPRPTVGQLRHLMERHDAIRGDVYDLSREVPQVDANGRPTGKNEHPRKPGATDLDVQEIGALWLSEVIETLTGEAIDSNDLPAWATTGNVVFNAVVRHWFEVPLAFGASPNGSEPETVTPAPAPAPPGTTNEPTIWQQAIPGQPLPG